MSSEFTLDLNPYLINGLRREPESRMMSPELVECRGLYPANQVLRTLPTRPSHILVPETYPYPQYLPTRRVNLVAHADALFELVGTALVPLLVVEVDQVTTTTLPVGNPWQVVPLGDSLLLYNGVVIVLYIHSLGKWIRVDQPQINAACYYRGRLLLGGFRGETWSDAWKAEWLARTTTVAPGMEPANFDESVVWWSSVGGGDYFSLIYPPANPIDMMYRNESNALLTPSGAAVRGLVPMWNAVLCITDDEIFLLRTMEDGGMNFGVMPLGLPMGSRPVAWGGNGRDILFLDEQGTIWIIAEEMQPRRLGYSEHCRSLTNPLIRYDASRQEWIIGDASTTFVLSKEGLGEVGGQVYYWSQANTIERDRPTEVAVETTLLNFRHADVKEIRGVEVSSRGLSRPRVYVNYRANQAHPMRRVGPFHLSPEGFTLFRVRGAEFSIRLEAEVESDDAQISDLRLRYVPASNRSGRGPRTTLVGVTASEAEGAGD